MAKIRDTSKPAKRIDPEELAKRMGAKYIGPAPGGPGWLGAMRSAHFHAERQKKVRKMASMLEVAEGLQILSKYCDADDCGHIAAEHDILYAGPDDFDPGVMSEEDRARMKELGWHMDDEFDCWARFV